MQDSPSGAILYVCLGTCAKKCRDAVYVTGNDRLHERSLPISVLCIDIAGVRLRGLFQQEGERIAGLGPSSREVQRGATIFIAGHRSGHSTRDKKTQTRNGPASRSIVESTASKGIQKNARAAAPALIAVPIVITAPFEAALCRPCSSSMARQRHPYQLLLLCLL